MTNKKIKIKYDGDYPNLCRGHLEVWVEDKYYDFGDFALISGGCCGIDENYDELVTQGKWKIEEEEIPQDFPNELKEDLLEVINSEIEWGCCGGCL